MRRFAWLAIGILGCGDNLSPPTTTRTQVIPSKTGDRVAYVLEPLLVGDNRFTETAPAVLVDLDTNDEIDTFSVGMTQVVLGTNRAWVLQSSFAEWKSSSAMAEPAERSSTMAIVDRDTFAVINKALLAPSIDTPIAVGDQLFDVSREPGPTGQLRVRAHDDTGGAQMIVDEPGVHPAWCSSADHLVYAFEREGGTLRVLDVRRGEAKWFWRRIDIPTTGLGSGGIACSQDVSGKWVVLDISAPAQSSLLRLDLEADDPAESATYLPGVGAPFALQSSGTAIVAQRTSDRRFVRIIGTDITPLDLYADGSTNPQPLVVGDQALFSTHAEFRIVDLGMGTVGPPIDVSYDSARVFPWPSAGGFAVMRYRGDELTGLGVAKSGGSLTMILPPLVRDPELLTAAGARMYVVTSSENRDRRQVFGFDSGTSEPVFSATPPECDPSAITTRRSCR